MLVRVSDFLLSIAVSAAGVGDIPQESSGKVVFEADTWAVMLFAAYHV